MKTLSSALSSAAILSFAILCSIGCNGLPETQLVDPQASTIAFENRNVKADIGEDTPARVIDNFDNRMLDVQIKVLDCAENRASRGYALIAMHPELDDQDFYGRERFKVRWYGTDGRTISNDNRLDCVAGGIYYVDVIDINLRIAGRATVTL